MSVPLSRESELYFEKSKILAKALGEFIDKSPSPFHVARNVGDSLKQTNFSELNYQDSWKLEKGLKYFTTINGSTVFAFSIGGQFVSGNGLCILGAHTDSPCFKLKPCCSDTQNGFHSIGVQYYGGGLWHTWFDRNLNAAGKVVLKKSEDVYETHLVNLEKPVATVPHLAIHLERSYNESFQFNRETQGVPVIATTYIDKLLNNSGKPGTILKAVAEKLDVDQGEIVDMELSLADMQPSCLNGLYDEFLSAPRLDNLFNTYFGYQGLINYVNDGIDSDDYITLFVCYDNEEVGSTSYQGAMSSVTSHIIKRILGSFPDPNFELSIARSFHLSADQAHATHPNYSEKHEKHHQVGMHEGVVIKINSSLRYATSSASSAVTKAVCDFSKVPYQEFVVRNDSSCGTTIGPLIASTLGVMTADIGFPMLAMHSIREHCGVISAQDALSFYTAFFKRGLHFAKRLAAF